LSDVKFTTETVENYLKAIYQLSEGRDGAAAQNIAKQVGVSGPAVSKMLRHLERLGFVIYAPYREIRLTEVGRKVALEVIRHHRLIELYLMEGLGYGWDRVHAEAERLEHHISEEFEDCIEKFLGSPSFDPHGDPIPTRDGRMEPTITTDLESQEDGEWVVVRRVADEDADLLRYLGERGIRPGTVMRLMGREPFGGSLQLQIDDRVEWLPCQGAQQVFVETVIGHPNRIDGNQCGTERLDH